ncbi:MAG: potassium channel family protein [Chloroflexota bacterium]
MTRSARGPQPGGANGHGTRARTRLFLFRHGTAYEIALTLLAAIWVLLGVAMRTAEAAGMQTLLSLSGLIGVIFLADWAVRARASGAPRTWMRHHWPLAVLALVGVLPVEPAVQIARFTLAFIGLRRVLERSGGIFDRYRLLDELVAFTLVITAAGGVLVYELETDVNPKLATLADGLWWALVTVSTVGYGDIAPVTPAGRVLASVLIVVGVAIFAVGVAIVGRYIAESRRMDAGAEARLAEIGRLERAHAAGEIDAATFSRRVRALTAGAHPDAGD